MSTKTDNLIVDFNGKVKSLIDNSNADPKSKKLVSDFSKELIKFLNELSEEL